VSAAGGAVGRLVMRLPARRGVRVLGIASSANDDRFGLSGRLEFPIAVVFPLDRVANAFALLERRRTHGKIVLLP
jgi:NADPH-dependent curcumin reductase CurA